MKKYKKIICLVPLISWSLISAAHSHEQTWTLYLRKASPRPAGFYRLVEAKDKTLCADILSELNKPYTQSVDSYNYGENSSFSKLTNNSATVSMEWLKNKNEIYAGPEAVYKYLYINEKNQKKWVYKSTFSFSSVPIPMILITEAILKEEGDAFALYNEIINNVNTSVYIEKRVRISYQFFLNNISNPHVSLMSIDKKLIALSGEDNWRRFRNKNYKIYAYDLEALDDQSLCSFESKKAIKFTL